MMHLRRLARALLGTFLALPLGGCGDSETVTNIVYAPYTGSPAYPNQRTPMEMPEGDLGIASNNGSDTLTYIDFAGDKVLGDIAIGRDPVDIDGPHHVAANRALGFSVAALAYPAPAVATGPHAAHGGSTRSGFVQKVDLFDGTILGEVHVDTNPGDIVLSADGKRVAVSHFELQKAITGVTLEDKRSNIALIDASTMALKDAPSPQFVKTCVAPHGLAFGNPTGSILYVACYGEDALAILDLDATPVAPVYVPVGAGAGSPGSPSYGPYAAVLNHAGSFVAVSNTESRDVRLFDVGAGAMSSVLIATLGAPYFAAFSKDDSRVFIPTQGPDEIVVADPQTGIVQSSRPLTADGCRLPHEVVFSSDSTTLYVLCEGKHGVPDEEPGNVLALDPDSLELKASYTMGIYPDRLLILPAP